MRVLLSAVFVLAVACSGSDSGSKETHKPTAGEPADDSLSPEQTAEAERLRKLRAQQDSAIEAMCERFYDCALQDANKSAEAGDITAEELAQITDERLREPHMAECEEGYGRSDLSPRQVQVVRDCVSADNTCTELQACLQQASKQGDE